MKNKAYLKIIFLAAMAMGLSSCGVWYNLKAYFNSYYNAKVLFDQVEENMKSLKSDLFSYQEPTIMAQDYLALTKVNEKCSKIMQFDANSGYLVDALWLSGKAFYFQKEYVKAERKFKELLNAEKDSVKLVEANLWLGKTELQLRNFDEANKILDKVALDAIKFKESEIYTNAVIKQIAYLIYKEQYPEAIEKCSSFLKNSDDDEKKAEVAYELGKFYYKNNDFTKASEAFKSVSEFSPTFETDFRSKLEYAKCLLDLEKLDEGISELTSLKNKSQYSKYLDEINVEIGTGYYYKKDFSRAMDIFTAVDTLYYGTKSSGVAEYMKAQIYEYHKPNFDSAYLYYETAKENGYLNDEMRAHISKKNSVFNSYLTKVNEIRSNKRQILYQADKSNFYRDSIAYVDAVYKDTVGQKLRTGLNNQQFTMTQRVPTTTTTGTTTTTTTTQTQTQTTLGTTTTGQSGSTYTQNQQGQRTGQYGQQGAGQKRVIKKKALPPKPEMGKLTKDSLQTILSEKYFGLAGLFFNEMDLPDSAIYYYNEVLTSYSNKPIVPEAYYALATVYSTTDRKEKADSLFRIVYEKYKDTPLAVSSAKKLGLIKEASKIDPAERVYVEAEQKYYDKKYTDAITQFRDIISKFPKSGFASKSAYYIAFIFENDIKDIDSTTAAYEYLSQNFTDSEAAKRAQKHHAFYQEEKARRIKASPELQKKEEEAKAQALAKIKEQKEDKPASDKTKDVIARPSGDRELNKPDTKALKDTKPIVLDSAKQKQLKMKEDMLRRKEEGKDSSQVLPDSIKKKMEKARLQDALKAKQKRIVDSLKAETEKLK